MPGRNFRRVELAMPCIGYLEAVSAIVEHYKLRRKTKKLLRHAFKFAGLPFDKDADPFTAIIRCTCEGRGRQQDGQQMVESSTVCRLLRSAQHGAESVYEGGWWNKCVRSQVRAILWAGRSMRTVRHRGPAGTQAYAPFGCWCKTQYAKETRAKKASKLCSPRKVLKSQFQP